MRMKALIALALQATVFAAVPNFAHSQSVLSKAVRTSESMEPALAFPDQAKAAQKKLEDLQPRPAPGRPSADRLQGGEDWTPIRGQHSAPIDTSGSLSLRAGSQGESIAAYKVVCSRGPICQNRLTD